ncbi:hypothetical protein [uncultured Sphingomonas sp.]|uniref:hypothetical protein n=1 Tax=uncultured Sphingomonas sp. TaxID=158754 RepID=UPI00261BB3BE|nr:hypothetical protein [uncultured Sphingomonas sp.]
MQKDGRKQPGFERIFPPLCESVSEFCPSTGYCRPLKSLLERVQGGQAGCGPTAPAPVEVYNIANPKTVNS